MLFQLVYLTKNVSKTFEMGSKNFGMTASHPPGRMVSSNNILKTEMDVFVRNGKRSSNYILLSTLASILNDGEHMVIFHQFFQKVILPIHQFTIQESIYLKWEIFMIYPSHRHHESSPLSVLFYVNF